MNDILNSIEKLSLTVRHMADTEEGVSLIARDLLLEQLRRLYEQVLLLPTVGKTATLSADSAELPLPDSEMLSSAKMATMAAMAMNMKPQSEQQPSNTVVAEDAVESAESAVAQPEAEEELSAMPEYAEEQDTDMPIEEEQDDMGSLLFDDVLPAEDDAENEAVRAAEEARLAEERAAEEARLAEERAAEEARLAEERAAEEARLAEERAAEEARLAEERAAEEARLAEERAAEEARLAEEKPTTSNAGGGASLLDYLRHPVEEQPTVRTLGERLGGNRSVSSFEKNAQRKVDDLRTVININDKFSFMSELFRNNMRAYNDFIMHLNSLTSREEALAHVAEVAERYGWDESSTVVVAFRRIFDKKF